MEVLISKVNVRYLRVSPRKIRTVIDLIRGKALPQAFAILEHLNKGTKAYVQKGLKSAMDNAKRNPQISTNRLFISKITADNGPMLKRYRAAAMGRATMIRHRTTHLTIQLSQPEVKQTKPKPKKRILKTLKKRR